MTTLLSEHKRHAAHGSHTCEICGQKIAKRELYLDQRCAGDGHAWTFRCHIDCNVRYWKAHRDMELHEDDILEWSDILEWESEDHPPRQPPWPAARGQ